LVNTGRKVRGLHGRSLLEERRGFHLPPPGISWSPCRAG
jgi:hypothetical protein